MENKKRYGSTRNPAASIGVGVGLSVLVMLIGALVVTALLLNEIIGCERLDISVLIVTVLATAVGSACSSLRNGRTIFLVALGSSLGFFTILLSVTALFFGGQYRGLLVTLLVVLGVATAVALVILKYMNRPKRYHKKH